MSEHGEDSESSTEKSILILNDEWGTSKGGIYTVHRQIAQQAKDAGFDVHVTTLEELSKEDKSDADEKGIKIIKAITKGSTKPDRSSINVTHRTYFPDLEKQKNFVVIIGHIPVTSEGATDIKDDRLKRCKVIQFTHIIAEDTNDLKEGSNSMKNTEEERKIIQLVKRSNAVFSVGPRVYNHYDGKFHGLQNIVHRQYIPYPDRCFFDLQIKPPEPHHIKRILTVGRLEGGYDVFVEALSNVCEIYQKVGWPLPKWDIRGIPEEEQEESRDFIKTYMTSEYFDYKLHTCGTQKEIMENLKQSHLFVMPQRREPFGIVGMEAIAAGIPVLITKNSGLADFIKEHFKTDAQAMVVDMGLNNYAHKNNVDIWQKRIIDALDPENIESKFSKAAEIKEKLQVLSAITDTHKEFQKFLQGN
ncbi:uncharacterized protein [Ptychodera flava]|uniref:uncharacterized protein n=1 Tax=Ptychodera flava TaxID=63121 RepID=UPI003969FAF8